MNEKIKLDLYYSPISASLQNWFALVFNIVYQFIYNNHIVVSIFFNSFLYLDTPTIDLKSGGRVNLFYIIFRYFRVRLLIKDIQIYELYIHTVILILGIQARGTKHELCRKKRREYPIDKYIYEKWDSLSCVNETAFVHTFFY